MTSHKRWAAPAKLNLLLKIVGRRADGYHLLQTVFQFTDWCDWLEFQINCHGDVVLEKKLPGVSQNQDLTVRAARLLQAETGCDRGVRISVEKNLPMGGGMGGGSSDAATTLVALNRLWGLGLSTECLMKLGLKLGADVPVFVYGHAAWAEGVGERLTKISPVECWAVVIHPGCNVDTGEIFAHRRLTRNNSRITIDDFTDGRTDNDCESVVRELYPKVDEALNALVDFGSARLTGTGSCVFSLFPTREQAQKVVASLEGQWNVHLVKMLNYSPLYAG